MLVSCILKESELTDLTLRRESFVVELASLPGDVLISPRENNVKQEREMRRLQEEFCVVIVEHGH